MGETLLDHFRAEMVSNGLGRNPHVAGDLHPIYREPRGGAVAPRQAEDPIERDPEIVLSLFVAPGIPPRPYESFFRTDGIDVWVLAQRKAVDALALHDQIRALFDDRRNWMMGVTDTSPGERVIESRLYRPTARLGSDAAGPYVFISGFLVSHYFPALTE